MGETMERNERTEDKRSRDDFARELRVSYKENKRRRKSFLILAPRLVARRALWMFFHSGQAMIGRDGLENIRIHLITLY